MCREGRRNFVNFKNWALENGYEKGLTLDRIDNEKGYSPKNCRWVTQKIQNINQRLRKNNTSGFRGVEYHADINKWSAAISINKKKKHLGHFLSKEAAYEVFLKARKERDEMYWEEFNKQQSKKKK